ncbi:regulatory protein GemA [Comamonas testosteroni]|uniref:gp16 family protein n=1 Tax=Comamonas testosteroni TaxID=285 RepID=UPI0023AB4328|nr:regulatory protein GemA [Comamonas testosteroni]WEE79608.1 regulatory protein GemA [Comamonas testosteroni]
MATTTQTTYRNRLIKLIQVARRDLVLDEPNYRGILFAQGGNDSLAAMPIDGMQKVLDYLKAQGFKVRKTRTDRKQATGIDASKVRALWLFLHELGAVRDPSEAALTAYVKRIVKVDDVQWMRSGRRVETVIESQKKWAMRYLPAAVATLKEEVRERYHKGLLSEEQTDCAARGFERSTQGEGFDVQWEAWENLRTAAGRPFPT